MQILERIRKRLAAREDERVASFEQLVQRIHSGNELGDDDAAQILERTGRSADDLQSALGHLKHRDQLRTEAAKLPALAEQREIVHGQRAEMTEKYEAAVKSFHAAMQTTQLQLDALEPQINRAEAARDQLRTAEFAAPELNQQRAQLESQRRVVADKLEAFRARFMSQDAILAAEVSERRKLDEQLHEAKRRREDISEIEAKLANLPAQTQQRRDNQRKLQEEYDRLSGEIADVERRMVE